MIIRQAALHSIDFDGMKIYDYTAEKTCSSSLAFIDVPPGIHHRLAKSSRSDKYYYVVAGKLFFSLDGIEYELGAGDFCLVLHGHVFSYANHGNEHTQFILVHTPRFELETEEFLD